MKFKTSGVLLTVTLLLSVTGVFAQSYSQSGMLLGRTMPTGSARVQGMGSTQVALGGDFSSALSNPAGLGMFNGSEISLTTDFSSLTTSAKYLGRVDKDIYNTLRLPAFALVINIPSDDEAFMGGSFGISYTRTNNFNQSFLYGAENRDNSIIDYFISDANGYPTSQFDEGDYQYNRPTGLAYYNYLIGPEAVGPSEPQTYFTHITTIPYQSESFQSSGYSGQWNFSYGANIKDKVFLGIGLGLTSLRYRITKSYSETFTDELKDL